jgi:predicted nicotinamide N-methyase
MERFGTAIAARASGRPHHFVQEITLYQIVDNPVYRVMHHVPISHRSHGEPAFMAIDPSSLAFPDDPVVTGLITRLGHTGKLTRERITVPGTGRIVDVIRPVDIETLLDQSASDPEQNLPYWAEIWPSGIALAAEILKAPRHVAGLPVLELGSGVGITAAIALAVGARLTATDYAPESITMTRLTCRMHTGEEPFTRQVNWRAPDADLLQPDGSRWPVVLAADVLYEERDVEPVLKTFARVLAPGGLVWLAEPGRRPARLAIERAIARGWRIETTTCQAEWPDPKDAGVTVNIHKIRLT